MKKPFILALDDDPSVIKAIERDLKSKFGGDYRILASDSPQKALDLVRQITARGDRIALFVVDQRMPLMSGTEFLQEAIKIQAECPSRLANRLRRFERCHRRHQQAEAEPLSDQTMGAARGQTVSSSERSAGRLGCLQPFVL